jgi:DNA-directed RNA polymerase specialized sigma24 family protein
MDDADACDWVRVRSGDPAALGALFDRHEARLFRQACRLLTSREDAKDAVTIAFFDLWRKRELGEASGRITPAPYGAGG